MLSDAPLIRLHATGRALFFFLEETGGHTGASMSLGGLG